MTDVPAPPPPPGLLTSLRRWLWPPWWLLVSGMCGLAVTAYAALTRAGPVLSLGYGLRVLILVSVVLVSTGAMAEMLLDGRQTAGLAPVVGAARKAGKKNEKKVATPPPSGRSGRVTRSIARVVAGDNQVGLAFALDERHVVTCAHVVNGALAGREETYASRPKNDEWVQLRFDGPTPGVPLPFSAVVVVWDPRQDAQWTDVRDVAVLRVTQELPKTVVRATLEEPTTPHGKVRIRSSRGNVNGEVMDEFPDQPDLLEVDQSLDKVFEAEPGASGGPVWRPDTGEVVGMLVARGTGKAERAVYVIASERIGKVWRTGDQAADSDATEGS